jgi:L,D-transpeptidase ErfK/SrfK
MWAYSGKTSPMPVTDGRNVLAVLFAAWLLCLLAPDVRSAELPPLSQTLVGSVSEYKVKPGDTLSSIGARQGIEWKVLAKLNGIQSAKSLAVGQTLHLDNRHVAPSDLDDGLVINLPQRLLFLIRNKKVVTNYPVAPGRPSWPTPTGTFEVVEMTEKPTWYVPKSIQDEWARAGKVVKTSVPPGPGNPLGRNWIGLSFPSYGIHGTSAPLSIYDFQSSGCIRLHSDDAEELFGRLSVGDSGVIVYEPILLAHVNDGRVFLEVHRDVYNKKQILEASIQHVAEANGFSEIVDWSKVASVIDRKDGLAEEIDLSGAN